jgi:hypothetical protein
MLEILWRRKERVSYMGAQFTMSGTLDKQISDLPYPGTAGDAISLRVEGYDSLLGQAGVPSLYATSVRYLVK